LVPVSYDSSIPISSVGLVHVTAVTGIATEYANHAAGVIAAIFALVVMAALATSNTIVGTNHAAAMVIALVGLTTNTGGASIPFREPAIVQKSTERRVVSIILPK